MNHLTIKKIFVTMYFEKVCQFKKNHSSGKNCDYKYIVLVMTAKNEISG